MTSTLIISGQRQTSTLATELCCQMWVWWKCLHCGMNTVPLDNFFVAHYHPYLPIYLYHYHLRFICVSQLIDHTILVAYSFCVNTSSVVLTGFCQSIEYLPRVKSSIILHGGSSEQVEANNGLTATGTPRAIQFPNSRRLTEVKKAFRTVPSSFCTGSRQCCEASQHSPLLHWQRGRRCNDLHTYRRRQAQSLSDSTWQIWQLLQGVSNVGNIPECLIPKCLIPECIIKKCLMAKCLTEC